MPGQQPATNYRYRMLPSKEFLFGKPGGALRVISQEVDKLQGEALSFTYSEQLLYPNTQ